MQIRQHMFAQKKRWLEINLKLGENQILFRFCL